MQLLMVQLLSHEGTAKERDENTISNMVQHMEWSLKFANRVTRYSVQKRMIERHGNFLSLTALGREKAKQVMTDY